MKKIVFALVVLMFAVPASAAVTITATQEVALEPNVIIGYTGDDVVRCFGLDIQLDNDETIIAVECLSDDYYLNPQKFTYDGGTPAYGDTPCLCNADSGLLEGIDTNGITIAMCSLYSTPPQNDPDHNTPPATSGSLLRITVSGECCITITENGKLGGVLLEDNSPANPTLPDPCCPDLPADECMMDTHPDYTEWLAVGSPNCWCYPRQCRGDVDDNQEYGAYWVLMDDLDQFKTYFGQTGVTGEPGICSDLAHDEEYGAYRVLMNDLDIFKTYFGNTTVPCCDDGGNCDLTGDTKFNFWTSP